jgi:hypothetical protein
MRYGNSFREKHSSPASAAGASGHAAHSHATAISRPQGQASKQRSLTLAQSPDVLHLPQPTCKELCASGAVFSSMRKEPTILFEQERIAALPNVLDNFGVGAGALQNLAHEEVQYLAVEFDTGLFE